MGVAVDRLERRIRRLGRLAGALQELAIDLAAELAIVRRTMAADASGRLETVVEYATLRATHARQRESLQNAAVGAWKMEMRMNKSGAAMVRIDEGKWFRLSRADARLLCILTSAAPVQAGGFPAWLTYEQIAERVEHKTGEEPTRKALIESVYRIRRALKSVDLNEFLLRVGRKPGRLQFLLRSAAASVNTNGRR